MSLQWLLQTTNTLNNQTYQNENTALICDFSLAPKQEFKLFVSVLAFQCFIEKIQIFAIFLIQDIVILV